MPRKPRRGGPGRRAVSLVLQEPLTAPFGKLTSCPPVWGNAGPARPPVVAWFRSIYLDRPSSNSSQMPWDSPSVRSGMGNASWASVSFPLSGVVKFIDWRFLMVQTPEQATKKPGNPRATEKSRCETSKASPYRRSKSFVAKTARTSTHRCAMAVNEAASPYESHVVTAPCVS